MNHKQHMLSKLTIIIVNWNAGLQLRDCVESIKFANQANDSCKVIIVDNASTDNSLDDINNLGVPVTILRNRKNIGFAAACNQGAAMVTTPFILFLNPDTRLFPNSLIDSLLFMMDPKNSHVGICGIQLVNNLGEVDRSCARFPTAFLFMLQATGLNKLPRLGNLSLHRLDWDHSTTQQVDHVIGAFFLIRRSLFEQLNGFDERFYVYLEDLDLSLRAHLLGWSSVYLTKCQAFHLGGGTSRKIKAERLFYSLRSRLHYSFKHFSILSSLSVVAATLFIEPVSRIVYAVARKNWKEISYTFKAYSMLFKSIPAVVCYRSGKLEDNN